MSEDKPKQMTQEEREKAVPGIVADLVVVISTAKEAASNGDAPLEVFDTVLRLLDQLLVVTMGPDWVREADGEVKQHIDARIKAITTALQSTTQQQAAPQRAN